MFPPNTIPGAGVELEAADGQDHGVAVEARITGVETLEVGESAVLTVDAIFEDGYAIEATVHATFRIDTPATLELAALTDDGQPVNAIAAGEGGVSVFLGSLQASTTITVTAPPPPPPPPPPPGLDVLGNFSHDINEVELTVIATVNDQLMWPRDLEFNPARPGELWVLNRGDDPGDESVVVIFNPGEANQSTRYYNPRMQNPRDFSNAHFMARGAALAMSPNNTMATIHETDELTQGDATPPDFMGPTLHSTMLDEFNAGHGGHLDMLHNSPLGVGIAWDVDNVYWVFDGYHSSITMYNFNMDHGLGGADHTDGEVARYAQSQVSRVPLVVSHMEMDHDTSLLYIADTGNQRIGVLDTRTGTRGGPIRPNYDGTGNDQYRMNDTTVVTIVDGGDFGMLQPSGLALQDNLIFVSDASTSIIWAFDKTGEMVDYLETGLAPGTLAGINFDPQGRLYLVDQLEDRVLRIAPR